jgi:ribosomal protein S18 acetylase RimI-like enzyme
MGWVAMAYDLRAATGEDRAFLYRLHVAALKEYVERTWGWDDADQAARFERRFDPQAYQVVVVGGRDIGAIQVERRDREIALNNIQVLPAFQGRGIGTAVICDLQAEARARGAVLSLQVLKVNPARKLYERLGFVVVGETATHYQMIARDELPGEMDASI